MTAPLEEICASCSRKPCTTLPNPRFTGCIGVLDNPHEAPHNCPLAITGQRQLSFALFGLNDMALRRLCDEATESARVLFGSAPRSPGQAEAYLGQLMEEGRIRMLAINPGQAIPAHLVRSPAKPAPKKEVIEQVAEIIEEAPPPPPKEEKKNRTPIHIIEVPDLLFSLGSPVPALDDKGWLVGALATAVLYAKDEGAERQERLIVCGHADTTGEPPRNYEIAEQRAQMIKALLDQNVEAWKTLANKHGKVRDYQQTLKSLATAHGWSCDPGKVDNAKGPQTEAAVKAFQQECNDRYNMGLTVDGDVGPKTWSAIHRTLCALVCEHLDIAGTAEPAPPKWLKPIYGFPAGQGIYSCGESVPVAAVGRNDIASEENRRVELVFAPTSLEVKAAPSKSVNMKAKDCVLYDGERVEGLSVSRRPCASDSIQMDDSFWDFFQEHFPGKDDPESFDQFIRSVYNDVPNTNKMEELREKILAKSLQKPDSFVVTRMRHEQLGAYGDKVIYLNQRLVLDAEYLPSSRWLLLLTLLHESGHFLDDLISCDYAGQCSDTPGEEGGVFGASYLLEVNDVEIDNKSFSHLYTDSSVGSRSWDCIAASVDFQESLVVQKLHEYAFATNKDCALELMDKRKVDVEFFTNLMPKVLKDKIRQDVPRLINVLTNNPRLIQLIRVMVERQLSTQGHYELHWQDVSDEQFLTRKDFHAHVYQGGYSEERQLHTMGKVPEITSANMIVHVHPLRELSRKEFYKKNYTSESPQISMFSPGDQYWMLKNPDTIWYGIETFTENKQKGIYHTDVHVSRGHWKWVCGVYRLIPSEIVHEFNDLKPMFHDKALTITVIPVNK